MINQIGYSKSNTIINILSYPGFDLVSWILSVNERSGSGI